MKTVIITGPPRTGTTGLALLINQYEKAFVSCELNTYHPSKKCLEIKLNKPLADMPMTAMFLKNKNWTIEQLKEMISQNKYPENIDIFGDKHPDYCLNKNISKYLVENYGNSAFFIFTKRNIYGTVYSFLKITKTKKHKYENNFKEKKPRWFTFDPAEALERIIQNYENMNFLYQRVANKIIVNYQDSMQNPYYIQSKLKRFLQIDLPIDVINNTYKTDKYDDWKMHLKDDEKRILNEFLKKK